jgi:tetratricopeptide (TPR) repeat protein
MGQDGRVEPARVGLALTSSSLSGTAGEVLQARDISGGVHFHASTRAGVVVPRQLPADVRGFVGREADLGRLAAALGPTGAGPVAVLVLVGTAGVGKSALAVRLAHRVRERFEGGQLFVNLRGYDAVRPLEPAAVLGRFLQALGVGVAEMPSGVDERAELYRSLLADRRVLIVLDNAATVGQVRPLLPGGSGCVVVVTSRNRLSGLAARDGALRIPVDLLPEKEAVELVAATTETYRSGDPPGALQELARLCSRLPLALRIASERAAARPLMPLETLIGQLRGESSLWRALSTEDETEADAVRTVFAWSYRALPQAAARAFRLLGLFPGPHIGVECAAVLLDEPVDRAAGLLDVLAGAHLIEQRGAARYQFHDLLRAYAADQARECDNEQLRQAALTRAVQWFLNCAHIAGQAIEDLRPGVVDGAGATGGAAKLTDRKSAAAWYTAEQANLTPIAHAAQQIGLEREAWQLAVTLGPLHATAGGLDEWLEITEIGLNAAERLGDRNGRAHVQMTRASALTLARRLADAIEALAEAREIFTAAGDRPATIDTENRLGLLYHADRDLEPAGACFHRVLEQAGEVSLPLWQALAHGNLAALAETGGMDAEAATRAGDALAILERTGADSGLKVSPLLVMARVERKAGRLESAEGFTDRAAVALADAGASRWLEYAVAFERADEALASDQAESALEGYWKCAALARSLGDRQREARTLAAIGETMARLGRNEEAIDFSRAAAAIAREFASPFDTASALAILVGALTATCAAEDALGHRAEAVRLLENYTDPSAEQLRARLLAEG